MMEWLTLKWSATLLWLKPPLCMPTACHLSGMVNFRRTIRSHISTRTVIRRLHHQGMRARRHIKRPQLTLCHRHARFDWSHDHLGWTIRTWRRVHWSDENRLASDYSACANVASKRYITTKCTRCTERPLPRPSGYEPVLSLYFRTTTFWAQLLLGVGV
jgi:hypothetical protein